MSGLGSGTRFGPYEVVAKLGEGGMGDVYRAREARLDRSVALKVSKEAFSDRFEREARAVAALNHPNICTLHDVGPNYLVMELVDGVPLAGPLPVEKAVEYAGQILDALEAAHRQGITHRDLKPANILVTKQGIKLLDFGLATKASPMGAPASDGATVAALTQQGQIVGTLQYMAPEQLQGQPVDARSDIFAFGCVLYELLSGKRAFDGSSQASVIAAILEREPAPLQLHPPLDRVIATCLAKDPDWRFQNARDLKRALAWAMEPVANSAAASTAVAWWQRPVVIAGAIVLALAAGFFVATGFRPGLSTQALPVTRFELPIDPGFKVWSPDGTQLAWLTREAAPAGQQQIFVRRRDDFENRLIDVGPGERKSLAFSPDGEWIAYTHAPAGHPTPATEVRKVRVTGGPSELVARVTVTGPGAAALAWEAGHLWLASGRLLQAIPESGGAVRTAVTLPENRTFVSGRLQMINGGRDLLFIVSDRTATGDRAVFGLWTAPLAGGEPREVMNQVISFAVTPAGDLLYTKVDGLLWARRFLEETLQVTGEPVSLMELSYAGAEAFALSPTGMLAFGRYFPERREPVWLQRSGGRVDPVHASLESARASYELSPDGRFLLITEDGMLRAWDFERQQGFQLSTGANVTSAVIAAQTQALFFQAAEGTGGLARLEVTFRVDFPWTSPPVKIGGTGEHLLSGVSPDGQRLKVFRRGTLGSVLINTDGTGAPVPVEASAAFSPDWRWVSFNQGPELWVRSEPAGTQAPRLIGQGQSFGAFWSPDSRELFYRDGNDRWMSVTVRGDRADASITLGQLTPLNVPDDLDLVALAPGGTRFLARRALPSPPDALAIVENFFEELRAKVPVK